MMKKLIYTLGVIAILCSCSGSKGKIISKANDYFGEPEEKENTYIYHNLTAQNVNKDFFSLRNDVVKILKSEPTESKKNFILPDSTGHFTAYIWDTQKLYVILWLNHPAKKTFVKMIFKKKSGGGI